MVELPSIQTRSTPEARPKRSAARGTGESKQGQAGLPALPRQNSFVALNRRDRVSTHQQWTMESEKFQGVEKMTAAIDILRRSLDAEQLLAALFGLSATWDSILASCRNVKTQESSNFFYTLLKCDGVQAISDCAHSSRLRSLEDQDLAGVAKGTAKVTLATIFGNRDSRRDLEACAFQALAVAKSLLHSVEESDMFDDKLGATRLPPVASNLLRSLGKAVSDGLVAAGDVGDEAHSRQLRKCHRFLSFMARRSTQIKDWKAAQVFTFAADVAEAATATCAELSKEPTPEPPPQLAPAPAPPRVSPSPHRSKAKKKRRRRRRDPCPAGDDAADGDREDPTDDLPRSSKVSFPETLAVIAPPSNQTPPPDNDREPPSPSARRLRWKNRSKQRSKHNVCAE